MGPGFEHTSLNPKIQSGHSSAPSPQSILKFYLFQILENLPTSPLASLLDEQGLGVLSTSPRRTPLGIFPAGLLLRGVWLGPSGNSSGLASRGPLLGVTECQGAPWCRREPGYRGLRERGSHPHCTLCGFGWVTQPLCVSASLPLPGDPDGDVRLRLGTTIPCDGVYERARQIVRPHQTVALLIPGTATLGKGLMTAFTSLEFCGN